MSTSAIAIPFPAPLETSRRDRVERTDGPHPPAKVVKLAEPMDELNQTPDRPSDGRDSLQQIKGIGQAIAQTLNSLGVHRYADLVNSTPDSLADLLKARIPSISPKRIERDDWIGQARALAQQGKSERTVPEEEMEAEKDSQKASSPKNKKLKQHAGFTLFFERLKDEHAEQVWQTRVYHDESGKEQSFPGVETAPWVTWILARAKLPVAVKPIPTETEVVPPQAPATPYDAHIEILDAQVSLIGPSSEVPENRLMAEVRFQISGAEAETLTSDRIPFRIEVHTVDLESKASKLVASAGGQLQPQVFNYIRQQTFPLPDLGHYELHSIVLLLPPGEMMALHRGPAFKVVP